MKSFSIIFVIFLFSPNLYAYSRFAFFHLNPNEQIFSIQSGYISSEIEYEQNNIVKSHYDAKYLRTEFGYSLGLPHDLMVQSTISAGAYGTQEKNHDSSLNISNQKNHFHGIQGFEFKLQRILPFTNQKTKYAFQLGSRGSLQTPKETNLAYGGFDIFMSLHWSHQHDTHYFNGNIKSEIVGRKKTKLQNGNKEVSDAYSVLGVQIGYIYTTSSSTPFGFSIEPHIYHTTDYNTRNPNFNRITDKGFIFGGKINFFKSIAPNLDLYFSHMRESYIFNVVDPTVSGEVDYEIERNETYLGFLWAF